MSEPTPLIEELQWLRGVARGLVADDAAAGDLTQEVALAALLSPPPVEGLRLRAWLWTVARRKAARASRSAAARRHRELESQESRGDSPASEKLHVHRELLDHVEALGEPDRHLIVERYLNGATPQGMAEVASVSSQVMRKRISRALGRLRARLAESERGPEGWALALCGLVDPGRFAGAGTTSGPTLRTGLGSRAGSIAAAAPTAPTLITLGFMKLLLGGIASLLLLGAIYWMGQRPATVGGMIAPPADAGTPLEPFAILEQNALAGTRSPVEPLLPPPLMKSQELTPPPAAAAPVSLKIVDEAGNPPPFPRAVWDGAGDAPVLLTIDPDGRTTLPFGRHGFVYATAEGFQDEAFEVDVPGGEFVISLRKQTAVSGVARIADRSEPRRWRFLSPHQGANRWPEGASNDRRLQLMLHRCGIPFAPLEAPVFEDGRFIVTLTKHRPYYELVPPADLEIVALKGAKPWGNGFSFDGGSEPIQLDLRQAPHAAGQLLWEELEEPVTGQLIWDLVDAEGDTRGDSKRIDIESGGSFRVPLIEERSADAPPPKRFEIRVSGALVRGDLPDAMAFATAEAPADLGTIRIRRPDTRAFRFVDALTEAPIPGAVISVGGGPLTTAGADGVAHLIGSDGDFFHGTARGYEALVGQPDPLLSEDAQAQEVRLYPSQRLRVVVPLASYEGFERDRSLRLRVRFSKSPFGAFQDQERDEVGFRELSVALQGNRLRGFDLPGEWDGTSDPEGEVDYRVVARGDLELDGLLPGVPFRLELTDGYGQTLQSRNLSMERLTGGPEGGVPTEKVVRFKDPTSQAAALDLAFSWPRSGRPYTGTIQIAAENRIILRFRTDATGRLRVPYLKPGLYRVLARGNNNSLGPGEGMVLNARAGENQVMLDAVGPEPGGTGN